MRRTVLDEPGAGRSRVPNAVVAGFTVLELLLVLAIAGIVTAVAVPNVDQAMKTYRGDFAARQVLTDLQATRMLALSRNVRYRMLLTANGNDLRPADAGDPVTLVYATVATYTLPAQTTFAADLANPEFTAGGVINMPPPAAVMIRGAGGAVGLTRTINVAAAGSMRLAR